MKFNLLATLVTSATFAAGAALPQKVPQPALDFNTALDFISGAMAIPSHFLTGGSRGLEQGTKGLVESLEGYTSESQQGYEYAGMPQQSPHPR